MEEIVSGLRSFENVWARVVPQETLTDEPSLLRELIHNKSTTVSAYRALCQRTNALVPVLREKRAQLRALQGEYFLLTGSVCDVSQRSDAMGNMAQTLREIYTGEEWAQEEIRRIAPKFKSKDTRRALLGIARQDEKHAAEVKRLIIGML